MRRGIETTGSRWHAATPHRRAGARRGARRDRWAIVALLTLTSLVAVPHKAHADGITDPDVLASVGFWSQAYRVDSAYVERVILCESGGDRGAYNPSGASGVLQFMPATFNAIESDEMADMSVAPGLSGYDPETRGVWSYDAQIHLFCWLLYTQGYAAIAQRWACA